MTDLDAILAQLAEGHWPRPTAALGRAIVERIRGLEAAVAEYDTENRRLTHRLHQERERRQSVERRHTNLVEHVKREVGARQHRDMQLDALLMVWCSGGCGGGVLRWAPSMTTGLARWWHRRPEVTEEIVAFAELNTKRLRTWFENNKNKPLPPAVGEGGTDD